ncbi:DUF5344 family protein [Cytobacillus purgationiresistens]|uniref:TIGR04197 family type VII secretion effector n=1 Tax=Cytobacillus purgationiresistens TaxID=863449 RepID=A0ABU0AN66_9BACI|nr:DUF5344 family protein [Cytobacillus purgationiresistens]MDQ0272729.1 hypothetical protein [Cytobacillus purgationiresistens]
MTEIKIQQSAAETAFNELASTTGELNTTKPTVNFNQSTLDFLQKLDEIEVTYYQTINQYTNLLLKAEANASSSVSEFIEFEKSLGSNMMKGIVK